MSRIDATFARLRADNRKAFVAYIMANDPDRATSAARPVLPSAPWQVLPVVLPAPCMAPCTVPALVLPSAS